MLDDGGVLLTRLYFASMLCWPLVTSIVVFWVIKKRILKPVRYFGLSIVVGYVSIFAIPTLILLGYALTGRSAEQAVLTSLLLLPLVLVVPLVVSLLSARICR